jgi:pyruvate dehydrogenase E2 component (dihydrolipoamide acetyltransferase)
MGADMREGTIIRWLKSEGDQVERGEAIAEIETDKANIEIESFSAGVLRKIIGQEGDVLPVGQVIAVVAAPEDDISKYEGTAPAASAPAAPTEPPEAMATQPTPAASNAPPVAPTPPPATPAPVRAPSADGRLRASPLARRLAEEYEIDLSQVTGTGPDGRIVKRDVEAARDAAQAAPESAPAPVTPHPAPGEDQVQDLPLSRIRQTIARRMQQAKQEIPHYYLTADIDMTEAMQFREDAEASLGAGGRITVNDVIVLATTKALQRHPRFNAYWQEDHLQLHSQLNIGIAIPVEDGLIVPAILDCAYKGLAQISAEARDLVERTRANRLRPEEYNATFSISNLGGPQFGIDILVAIVNPPQVAILGIGAVREKPVVRDRQITVRQMMSAVLSADHRATDGAEGARFLMTLRQMLETPGLMLV